MREPTVRRAASRGLWLRNAVCYAALFACGTTSTSAGPPSTPPAPLSVPGHRQPVPHRHHWSEEKVAARPLGMAAAVDPSLLEGFSQAWEDIRVDFVSTLFRHSSTHPRFLGPGTPLISTSWRNRPFHVGWFAGPLFGDEIIRGGVAQDEALFGGYRVGWDFDHYWGAEWRIGWSNPELTYLDGPQVDRTGRLLMTDLNVAYYPWGDSEIRPYAIWGAGITTADFRDEGGIRHDETLFSMPFGGGVKHHFRRWLAWRVELLDNLAFAGGEADTMHNVSLTFGIEVHLGARPHSYWPWHPSRHIW